MSKYFVVNGMCSTRKVPVGYQFKEGDDGVYYAVGSMYLSASSGGAAGSNDTRTGRFAPGSGFKCKACDNTCIHTCKNCGTLYCITSGATEVTCPNCGQVAHIRWVDSVDELEDHSNSTSKQ